ncbi:MAG: RraA family protein [Solirubrobacteraceae bacterium]
MVDRLLALEVSALSDADKSLPIADRAIRPMVPGAKFAGPAFTVTAPGTLLPVYRALAEIGAGQVLVVDTQGTDAAVLGEIFTTEARRRGVAGIVIDGWCRDLAGIREIGLPLHARGAVPNVAAGPDAGASGDTIRFGGIDVAPGDIVFGDDDGLLIAAPDRIEAALPAAEAIILKEREVLAALATGAALHEHLVLGADA